MVCAVSGRETQGVEVELTEDEALTVTDLSSFISPLTFVGGADKLGDLSADPTEEAGTTGTESGDSSSPTGNAEDDSGSGEEDEDNSGLRATFDMMAAGLAGLIGAAGMM